MNRYKAALIHFSLSLLVAGVAVALLLGLWYPPPYFQAGGADKLLLLVVGVDVVLGPLLTLLVFNPKKPELKRDLAIIVLLQLAALGYGFHVMLQSRPAFLVAAVDRFIVVSANQIEPEDLAQASQPAWRKFSWTGPELVAVEFPTAPGEQADLVFSALAGKDIEKYPRYYVAYDKAIPALLQRAQPLSQLRSLNPENTAKLDAWLQQQGRSEDSVRFLPVVARMKDITMLLDGNTGMPLGAIALEPW